jgi:hypothetical protein
VCLTARTFALLHPTEKGIWGAPKNQKAQEDYFDDFMLSQLEDSKKDALESQIMNDSYDFSNHKKMPPEDDASRKKLKRTPSTFVL